MVPGNRPGEGSTVIAAAIQTFVSTDGKSVSQLGMNLSHAEVPDRKYAADTCAVSYQHQSVRIIFGQERFDGTGLRSAVAVKMSPRAVVQLLASMDSSIPQTLMQAIKDEGIEVEKVTSAAMEPTQAVVVLAANLALAAASGGEGCIDFYQASPFALGVALHSASNSTANVAIEPVARVDLNTGLLLGLVDELKRISTQFVNAQIWRPVT